MGLRMWEPASPSIEAVTAYVYTCADFFAAPINDSEGFANWLKQLDLEYQKKALDSLENLFALFKKNNPLLKQWEEALLGSSQKKLTGIADSGEPSYLLLNLLHKYPRLYDALKQLIAHNHQKPCFVTKWYAEQATDDMNEKATARKMHIHEEQNRLAEAHNTLNKLLSDFLKKHPAADKNTTPKIQLMRDLQKILVEKNLDLLAKLARFKLAFVNNTNLLTYRNFSQLSRGSLKREAQCHLHAQNIAKKLYHLVKEIDGVLTTLLEPNPPAQQPALLHSSKSTLSS